MSWLVLRVIFASQDPSKAKQVRDRTLQGEEVRRKWGKCSRCVWKSQQSPHGAGAPAKPADQCQCSEGLLVSTGRSFRSNLLSCQILAGSKEQLSFCHSPDVSGKRGEEMRQRALLCVSGAPFMSSWVAAPSWCSCPGSAKRHLRGAVTAFAGDFWLLYKATPLL